MGRDRPSRKGADYGWNLCEGDHDNPSRNGVVNCSGQTYTGPIYEYSHDDPRYPGCSSITGGAFVPNGIWPASSYDTAYLYGDYVCNKIFKLTPKSGGGFTRTIFAGGLGVGGPISMEFGPYGTSGQALYYTTFDDGGEVRRIVSNAGNRAPVATADTAGANYDTSLTMDFDASASRDPDGDTPLTYRWSFGDGSKPLKTADPTISYTYGKTGKYEAKLTVEDNLGNQSLDTIEVFPGNTPPRPIIESPSEGTTFRVDQLLTATGSVTDAEDDADGNPATAPTLRLEVLRYHDGNHFHPWASDTDRDVTFEGPPPEGLESTEPRENYLQVRLTATDSQGLSRTVTRRLEPRLVNVRFQTRPLGLDVQINGLTFGAPKVLASWEGYAVNVDVKRQRDADGRLWAFDRWSHGRAKAHTIETPAVTRTYTAFFRRI